MLVVALGWYLLKLMIDPEIKVDVPGVPEGCELDADTDCTTEPRVKN
jgi:hypothetical protein